MQAATIFLGVATLVALFITLIVKYPALSVVAAVGAAAILDCVQFDGAGQLGLEIHNVNIYVDDITCALLLTAAVGVSLRRRVLPDSSCWPVLALFGLAVLNFVRGASQFGLKPAGNDARSLGCFILPLATIILLRPVLSISAARIARWLTILACVLSMIALARWLGALPMPNVPEEEFREVPRAIPAEYALVIGQAWLGVLFLQVSGRGKIWTLCLSLGLPGLLLALQHRSVWLATLGGFGWLAVRTFQSARKHWLRMAATASLGAILLLSIAGTESIWRTVSIAEANLQETWQPDSTWNWRVGGFEEARERVFAGSPVEMLVGPPSGEILDARASTAAIYIHSRYVATLAYYGTLGALVLVVLLSKVAMKLAPWTHNGYSEVDRSFLQALLLSQLLYFFAYTGGIVQGAVTALLWLASPAPIAVAWPLAGTRRAELLHRA